MPCNPITCDTFTLRTADILETFYFDNYDVGEAWGDWPARMVDGRMTTAALTFNSNEIQYCNNNSSPTDRDTTITKVEIRAHSVAANSCGTLTAYLRPVFTTGDGDTHSWLPIASAWDGVLPEWSQWLDITSDTNAPVTWAWSDVNNLGVDHWMIKTVCGNPDHLTTTRIEIRVTWHDSVTLSGPLPDSLDNKLNKMLKQFNLWRDYKLHDESIEGQPLNLNGVEIGVCETTGDAYGTCFPLCFPICFDTIIGVGGYKSAALVAQEKFEKIHSWMENNYNVTLSDFGDCFDAEFAIKNFTVQSMNHPSNYKWSLSLEKAGD